MSQGVLFGIGFITFVVVSTAVLMASYVHFSEFYTQELPQDEGAPAPAD